MEIEITEDELRYLSEQAEQELESIVTQYTKDIISEAHRLEAGERNNDEMPDVSRIHVRDASISLKRYQNKSSKSKWYIPIKIAAAVSGMLVGILIPEDPSTLTILSYIFIFLLFAFALVTVTLDVIWSNK